MICRGAKRAPVLQSQSDNTFVRYSFLYFLPFPPSHGWPNSLLGCNIKREAGAVGRALVHIEKKVEKLALLAKKDGIFDDATLEISELTAMLKLDRDRCEKLIEILGQKADSFGSNDQSVKHAKNVVKTLEMKLGDCTQGFTRALELRTKTVAAQQKKRQAFTGGAVGGSTAPHLALDMGRVPEEDGPGGGGGGGAGGGGSNFMQQELLELDPQTAQLRAIQQIETTLVQLGQMFSQFSVLVQRQGEQIERIDARVEETQSNIERAQEELMKYMQSIQGNRSLILKLFGVTAAFVVAFVMFF